MPADWKRGTRNRGCPLGRIRIPVDKRDPIVALWRAMVDQHAGQAGKPRIAITYCTQCQWLLRSAWMAQELLSTFRDEVGEVALVPGTGGIFTIVVGTETIWDRARDGGFPDVKTLKQRVRDRLAPARDLGHLDRA